MYSYVSRIIAAAIWHKRKERKKRQEFYSLEKCQTPFADSDKKNLTQLVWVLNQSSET